MYGPMPKGHWTSHDAPNKGKDWRHLISGQTYEVIKAFDDYDLVNHPVGERWMYLGFGFLPYDSGLSLIVSLGGEQEWHIRMQLREEEQDEIIEKFEEYVKKIKV